MASTGNGAGDSQQTPIVLNFSGRERYSLASEIEAALAVAPAHDHEVRARLWATLASAHAASPEQAAVAAERAGLAAAQAATTTAQAWASFAMCVANLAPEQAELRARLTNEILQGAPTPATTPLEATAYFLLLGALTELGRIAELDKALDLDGHMLRTRPHLDDTRYAAWFRCVRATLDGRRDDAEALAEEGMRRAKVAGDPDRQSVLLGQLAVLRWMSGRASELEPMLLQARQLMPDDVIWAATLAWVWLSMGRTSAARGLVRSLGALTALPRDRNWLAALSILAVVVAQLQERDLCREAIALLDSFADRLAPIGLGVTVWGTVARPLSMMHRSLGQDKQAHDMLVQAIDVCTVAGAHAWLAEAQFELAELLIANSGVGRCTGQARVQQIEGLLHEAGATARVLEMHDVEQKSAALLVQLKGAQISQLVGVGQAVRFKPKVQVFGGFGVTSVDGSVAHWQSQKARDLVKVLVANRGAPVHKETMMDLLWPGEHPDKLGNRLAVALVTVRRAFDPHKYNHRNAFVSVSRDLLRLNLEHVDVDIEHWFERATQAMQLEGDERVRQLTEVLAQARQPVLADERDSGWAEGLRREVMSAAFAAAYELATTAQHMNEPLRAAEAFQWILDRDSYDMRAHHGLIAAYTAMGAHGHAAQAQQEFERCMAELGV